MKSLFTIFFLSLLSITILPQWQQLNPNPTNSTTYMGAAPSANKYVTVLDLISQILMTTDGGLTWSRTSTPSTGQIRTCYFIDDNKGWIGGASNILYKTTDGGQNWVFVPAIDTIKYDINFLNENEGWACGLRGFIMRTSDGGANWISRSISHLTTGVLYGVYPLNKDTVFVAGNSNSVFRTTDGGETFTQFTSPFGTSTEFREIKFVSSTTGFVVGGGTRIAKTTNCGESWTAVNSGSAVQLWGLSFNSTGTIGLASGASSTVLRTTNGGDSWTPITGFPASLTFYSCRFAEDNDNVVYLSGSTGYVYKSTDAGATFTEISYHFTGSSLKGVNFANNETGYVVGTTFIAKTTNSGFTWTQQTSPYTGDINEICAPSVNVAVAGCDGGNVIRTSDGGTNWTQVTVPLTGTTKDILAIDFTSDSYGMVVGYSGSCGITTDAGLNWSVKSTVLSSGSIWALDMVNENFAWAGGSGIYKTSDGGATWQQQLTNSVYAVAFLDTLIGVAGGSSGVIYYTSDGGANWITSPSPASYTIWSMSIAPSTIYGSVAFAACASGYVYKSTDGGITWTQEPRASISTYDDVTMKDAGHAWVVGSSGTIIRYLNPENPSTTFQVSVDVNAGWNMVSIPGLHPTNQNVDTWWPFKQVGSSVFQFNGSYQAVTVAENGKGYWMRHSDARTYNTGDEWPAGGITIVPNNPIPGNSGWNMIGCYNYNVATSGITTSAGSVLGSIFGYSGGYNPVTTLLPGYGYWIRLSEAANIILPNAAFKGAAKVTASIDDKWGKIILTDNSGRNYTLYAADGQVDLTQFDMPPAPPAGMMDVRYESQRYVENLNDAVQTIDFNGMEYPVTVRVEGMSIRLQDQTGKVINTILKAGEKVTISSNEVNKLMVSGDVIPDEYSLSQNYPNPFNPGTVIEFTIPEDVHNVTLTIYDALGQKVAEILNGNLQAGYYKYNWNAGQFASGIYIYQLRTEKFVSTKKMMLLK